MTDQTFVTVNAIIAAGLLAVIAAFIGYVWPRVKDQVDQDKDNVFDEFGKSIANEFRNVMASNPSLFRGQPTEKTWEVIGQFYATIFKESVESIDIASAQRPLSTLRDAVFALILASLSFLAAVGLALSVYEYWSGLVSVIGGMLIVYFLYKVAMMWHDLSR